VADVNLQAHRWIRESRIKPADPIRLLGWHRLTVGEIEGMVVSMWATHELVVLKGFDGRIGCPNHCGVDRPGPDSRHAKSGRLTCTVVVSLQVTGSLPSKGGSEGEPLGRGQDAKDCWVQGVPLTEGPGGWFYEAANLILNDNEILIVEKMTRPANRDPRCLSQSHPNGRRVAGDNRRTEDEK